MVSMKVSEFGDTKKFETRLLSKNIPHSFFYMLVKFLVQNIFSIIFQDMTERKQENKHVNISRAKHHI